MTESREFLSDLDKKLSTADKLRANLDAAVYKIATREKFAEHGHVLTPSRYGGKE